MPISNLRFGHVSRVHGIGKTEKCPRCLEIGGGSPFVSISCSTEFGRLEVLVCPKPSCRCVFVPSYMDLDGLIKNQNALVCDCGFVGKDERGLKVHKSRFCKLGADV